MIDHPSISSIELTFNGISIISFSAPEGTNQNNMIKINKILPKNGTDKSW
jgi:hypothetical protein